MSQRTRQIVASFLCQGTACPHHLAQADFLLKLIEEAQKKDREEEAQKALDRIVENFKDGTHAV